MPQILTFLNRRRDPAGRKHANAIVQLRTEQLGVIAGFLFGLALGFLAMGQALQLIGAPAWFSFLVGALITAVCTRIGQQLAMHLTKTIFLAHNHDQAT